MFSKMLNENQYFDNTVLWGNIRTDKPACYPPQHFLSYFYEGYTINTVHDKHTYQALLYKIALVLLINYGSYMTAKPIMSYLKKDVNSDITACRWQYLSNVKQVQCNSVYRTWMPLIKEWNRTLFHMFYNLYCPSSQIINS